MLKVRNVLDWLHNKAWRENDNGYFIIKTMVANYLKYERYKQLERVCKACNVVAIHAVRMTEHKRKINRSRHLNLNGKTYYLIPRNEAWQVGVLPDKDDLIIE